MFKLAVVIASFTISAVSGARFTNLSPRKADCGGINIAVRSEPFPSTAADGTPGPLLNCSDIPGTTYYSELTQFTCFMPAPDASEAEAVRGAAMPAPAPDSSSIAPRQACAGEFWCSSGFTPPANVNDANALCPLIPNNVVVAPYTAGYGCICAAYALVRPCRCSVLPQPRRIGIHYNECVDREPRCTKCATATPAQISRSRTSTPTARG
ncbi:hypothetical protein C8Q80DRAFT_607804 [Daedaleopsis nitida]|nr:hypothetical protein C8Q80DRAFT_607804 [Daedaleopsis nitida]